MDDREVDKQARCKISLITYGDISYQMQSRAREILYSFSDTPMRRSDGTMSSRSHQKLTGGSLSYHALTLQ